MDWFEKISAGRGCLGWEAWSAGKIIHHASQEGLSSPGPWRLLHLADPSQKNFPKGLSRWLYAADGLPGTF